MKNYLCLLIVAAGLTAMGATRSVVVDPDTSEIEYPIDFFSANSDLIVDAIPWENVHGAGSTDDRPSCNDAREGFLYGNTDNGTIERCINGSWELWVDLAVGDHNHDDRYVLKSGDTMTGSLQVGSTNASHGFTRIVAGGSTAPGYYSFWAPGGARVGHVGWKDNAGNYLQLQTEAGWNWTFTAQPYVGTSPIWHAGNDGSGSGLDADLLDGLTSTNFALWNHNHDSRYVLTSGGSTIVGNGLTIQGTGLTLKAQASTNPALYVPMWEANPITSGYRLDARHITNLFADMGGHDASRITTGKLNIALLDATGSRGTNTFLRGDATWAEFPSLDGGISEAPNDGKIYRRKNASWYTANTLEGLQIDGGVFSNTVTLNNRALLGFMKYKGQSTNMPDEHWKIATIQPNGAGQSATLFVRSIGGSVSAVNKGIVELMVGNRNGEQITYWVRGTKPTQYSIKVYREADDSLSVYAYLPGTANQYNGFGLDAWMGNWENPASFTSQVYLNPVDVGPSPTGTLVFDATAATPDWHHPHQSVPSVSGTNVALVGHTHSASDTTSGVFNPARLGTGTATTNTVLHGNGEWRLPSVLGAVDYIDFKVGTNIVRMSLLQIDGSDEYTISMIKQ